MPNERNHKIVFLEIFKAQEGISTQYSSRNFINFVVRDFWKRC